MKNELLKIGPLTVYGYGAMIALGVIAAWVVTCLLYTSDAADD